MGIGGGDANRYIVYATDDNVRFYTLLNPGARDGKCSMVAGGQLSEYELKCCVTLEMVLLAAKTYAEGGTLEPRLVWNDSG